MPRSDLSIALEGAGAMGICLGNALATVQKSDNYQIDSFVKPLASPGKCGVTMLDLKTSDVENIKEAFGKAVLTSRKDDTKLDLHADLVGLSDHYNRVGQNWRLLGNKFTVEARRNRAENGMTRFSHASARGRDSKFASLERAQILVYGDK